MTKKNGGRRRSPEERRKRVQSIKLALIYTLLGWMLITLIALVLLTVKVFSLQKQVNRITEVVESTIRENSGGKQDISTSETDTGNAKTHPETETTYKVQNGMSEENRYQEGDSRKVYLTFDDGPGEKTGEILDILKENGVKATFFVVGSEAPEATTLYQRIVEEGHTIGMHSYSHKFTEIYGSEKAFTADLQKLSDTIREATGVTPSLYRFPGGSNNRVSNLDMGVFIHKLDEKGITYFDWNVTAGDATVSEPGVEELVENVMADVVKYKTSVVLLHDGEDQEITVEALPSLISEIQKLGAEILPITDSTDPIQYVTLAD